MKRYFTLGLITIFTLMSGCKKDDNSKNANSATIQTLGCSSVTYSSTFTKGFLANNIIASIPYTGGNGGKISTITINSTGVVGLIATSFVDSVSNGNGILKLKINGTPASSGVALFSLSIGGQTCTFQANVATDGYFISFTKNAKDTIISAPTCNLNYGFGGEFYSVSNPQTGSFNTADIKLAVTKDSLQFQEFASLINKKLQLNDCSGCGESASIQIDFSSSFVSRTDAATNPLPNYFLVVKSVTPSRTYVDVLGERHSFYIITGEFKAVVTTSATTTSELTNGKFRLEFGGVPKL